MSNIDKCIEAFEHYGFRARGTINKNFTDARLAWIADRFYETRDGSLIGVSEAEVRAAMLALGFNAKTDSYGYTHFNLATKEAKTAKRIAYESRRYL